MDSEKLSEKELYPDLKGLTMIEAQKHLPNFTIRCVTEDGKHLLVTQDLHFDRINVELRNGVIQKVIGLG